VFVLRGTKVWGIITCESTTIGFCGFSYAFCLVFPVTGFVVAFINTPV